jgi:preprotein translocase subunit SecA
MVTRRIEAAQKKVEERNFEIRKNLLEYDEVMDEQRKRVYGYRQKILDGVDCRHLILKMVHEQVNRHVNEFLSSSYGIESFASYCNTRLGLTIEPREFRGLDFSAGEQLAKEEAERLAETHVFDAIEENLPEEEDTSEWNWEALAKFANTRWGLNLRDRDLKKAGRDDVAQLMIDNAREAIARVDLSEAAPMLEEDFGYRAAAAWVQHKFGFTLDLDEIRQLEAEPLKTLVCRQAEDAYDRRESAYPIMAGFYRFSSGHGGNARLDRDALLHWAALRFDAELDPAEFRNKQRDEIRDQLLSYSAAHLRRAEATVKDGLERVASLFADAEGNQTAAVSAGGQERLEALSKWLNDSTGAELAPQDIGRLRRDELEQRTVAAVEDRYRPEIRRMERTLLLQIVDSAWKDHLLAMDHLRSSVGLAGYAQLDPKVEYKREGMRLFERMWASMGERVTDLIFRMEQLDQDFVGSTWVETSASHEAAASAGEMAQQQLEAIDASQGELKIETIRNRGERVGRNDPCPCGSGKKYKQCCMRKGLGVA